MEVPWSEGLRTSGAFTSKVRRREMFQGEERGKLPFLCPSAPCGLAPSGWMVHSHIAGSFIQSPDQMPVSSGKISTDTLRNNAFLAIWVSLSPVKLTQEVNSHGQGHSSRFTRSGGAQITSHILSEDKYRSSSPLEGTGMSSPALWTLHHGRGAEKSCGHPEPNHLWQRASSDFSKFKSQPDTRGWKSYNSELLGK